MRPDPVTLDDGSASLGLDDSGTTFAADTYIGIRRDSDGFDPIAPGTPRDSWGVNAVFADSTSVSGSGDPYDFGNQNITPAPATGAGTTGQSSVIVQDTPGGPTLLVTEQWSPTPGFPFVYQGLITITNTYTENIDSLRYARNTDVDVYPTEFDECIAIYVNSNDAVCADDYGFDDVENGILTASDLPCPLTSKGEIVGPTGLTFWSPGDKGYGFQWNFQAVTPSSPIQPGSSHSFTLYVGVLPPDGAGISDVLSFASTVGAQDIAIGVPSDADTSNGCNAFSPYSVFLAYKGVTTCGANCVNAIANTDCPTLTVSSGAASSCVSVGFSDTTIGCPAL